MLKKIHILIFTSVLLLNTAFSQTTYDVFTYDEPKGYKKEVKTGFTSYTKSDAKTGIYCIISLYAQSLSSGDLTKDFDNDWRNLAATPLNITAVPQKDNGDEITGWKTYSGAANFEFGGGTSMALLTTAKNNNANVAILIITNSHDFLTTDADTFFTTIKLGKPVQTTVAANNNSQNNNTNTAKPTSIIGEWLYDDGLISILYDYSGHANNDTYNNDVKMTVKNKITIKADGTYEDYTFYNKGTFKKKEITAKGKYKLNGNTITFTPAYHQYIKNDVVQPKDDARNLKITSAAYSFVYDEKAKAWGVKLTGADANSYFPDEVYLKADAYKKNTAANQQTTKTPPPATNANDNKLLSDAGIAGVWVSYSNPNAGLGNLSWSWRVFFSDKKSLSNLPNGGFYNLKPDSYFDNSKNNAAYFSIGSYSFANGKGTNVKSGANYSDKLELSKLNQLKIDGTLFMKCTNVTGQKLSGSFTTYANSNDPAINNNALGYRSVITFTSDGKFNDEGVYKMHRVKVLTN
jgi:hypothetical protein